MRSIRSKLQCLHGHFGFIAHADVLDFSYTSSAVVGFLLSLRDGPVALDTHIICIHVRQGREAMHLMYAPF